MIDVGARIKQLRIQNGLTLQELASRTELTKGFLSQLERNQTAPSLQTLEDITEALGTTMSKFFADNRQEKVVFTPEDAFVDEQEGCTIHWIIPNAQKNDMEPLLLELEPGGLSKVIEPHEGQEMGYVLNGKIILVRENRKNEVLKKGDAFYIDGTNEHHLENRTNKKATVLWISTPPEF